MRNDFAPVLAPVIIPRLGEADPQAVVMRCDGSLCIHQPKRAPRVLIPSLTPFEPGHRPVRVMTTLHYCEFHRDDFDWKTWLTDRVKADVERTAKQRRPDGFRPDFENVRVEHVLITTPEYREFLNVLGVKRVVFG